MIERDELMSDKNIWPDDTDGDVLRILDERGFDFSCDHNIEFNIDFKHWPLNQTEQEQVREKLPMARFIDPTEEDIADGDDSGFVICVVKGQVSYDFVVKEQKRLSDLFASMDGHCDSWAVCSPCGG